MAHEHIVLIDDDEDMLELCARRLKSRGYEITAFSDPTEAMKNIRATKPDLVISDMKMPGLNGVEVYDCLKSQQQTSDLPIIFITGLKDKRQYVESLKSGSVFFMLKPFDNGELFSTIQLALQTSLEFDDGLA